MNAEKFTQKTIETINTAQAMAQENQNQYLTPAHLLYALIDQDGGLIGSLLSKMGADCDAMLGELDAEIAKLPKVSGGSGEVYASPETSKLLRFAEKAAEKLGLAFADTDERIERASGRTIPEIFASEGEEGFRARELDVSRALAREGGLVIACGGGLPTRAEAIAALKTSGVVFWLNREPALIYDTVSMAHRPLGQGGKEAFLERFRQREPIYRRWADYIIEGHTLAAEAAGRIAALYERECQA